MECNELIKDIAEREMDYRLTHIKFFVNRTTVHNRRTLDDSIVLVPYATR